MSNLYSLSCEFLDQPLSSLWFCRMGRFPLLSVAWSQRWKGHLKDYTMMGLTEPWLLCQYWGRSISIEYGQSQAPAHQNLVLFVLFINSLSILFNLCILLNFLHSSLTLWNNFVFLFRCWKVNNTTSWVLHITDQF